MGWHDVAALNQGPLLEFIEESATVGTWVWEPGVETFYWSRQMFTITGLDPTTVQPSLELYKKIVHPDDRLDLANPIGLVRSGRLDDHEFRIIRPNGTVRWLRSRGRLLHRADGSPWKMIGFAQDITDIRADRIGHAAQDALANSVRTITDALVWIASPNGSSLDEANWWHAIRRNQTLGAAWARLDSIHPDDSAGVRAAWARAISDRRSYHSTFRMMVSGQYERFVSHAEPVLDGHRELIGWAGITMRERGTDSAPAAAKNIPGPLIRAARAYLGYSVQKMAEVSRLSSSTIRRMEEGGAGQVTRDSEETLVRAFNKAGISFYVDQSGLPQLHVALV